MKISIFGKPAKAEAPAKVKEAPAFGGLCDDDSGSEEGDEKALAAQQMRAQAERNRREAEKMRAAAEQECADIFTRFDEEKVVRPEAGVAGGESGGAAEKPKVEFKKSRFIASMKKSAVEREHERELTDMRLIQTERGRTDHLYTEKDAEVAPIVTPAYAKKLEEQRQAEEKARDVADFERKNAAAKIGTMSFNQNLLDMQVQRNDAGGAAGEDDPEEEYQQQLAVYLHKKEQQRKKDRRDRYLQMKAKQRQGGGGAEAEAEAEADAGEPAAPQQQEAPTAAPADAVAETPAAEQGGGAEAEAEADAADARSTGTGDDPMDGAEGQGGGAAGEGEEEEEEGHGKKVQRLAIAESERVAMVRERRLRRLQKRNTPEDVDRFRDRYLKRRLDNMRVLAVH